MKNNSGVTSPSLVFFPKGLAVVNEQREKMELEDG